MTGNARHRFVGAVGELCKEMFGGAAACALSYAASLHFNDQDHPYWSGDMGECRWVLQNTPGAAKGHVEYCCADKDDPMHVGVDVMPDVEAADTARITIDWEKVAPDNLQGSPEWQEALVGMPDVAAEALAEGEGHLGWDCAPECTNPEHKPRTPEDKLMEALAEEAGAYAWQQSSLGGADFVAAPAESGEEAGWKSDPYPQEEWARAVFWLESIDVELTYGPWPVRKYLLGDAGGFHKPMAATINALDELGMGYTLSVYRPAGCGWRVALVTWDWASGLGVASLGDELAARYGD